jgi:hypothetical protein
MIISLPALGIMIKINTPEVRKTSCKRTLRHITLVVVFRRRSRRRSRYEFVLKVRIRTGWLNIQFGGRYFRSVLLIWRELLFSAKGGLAVSKRGLMPPFSSKRGPMPPFLREIVFPANKIIPKCTDRDFLRYRYGKYQEIPTDTDRKIPIRYTTLDFWFYFQNVLNLEQPNCPVFCSILAK